jgi:hypothetical protein
VSVTAVDRAPDPTPRLLAIAGFGAAVAVALGVYGRVHDPSQELVFTLFFSTTISMKVWLASVALVFAFIQITSAAWVYGKFGDAPPWAGTAHKISGRLAFIISLPVAYHCLWSLGLQSERGARPLVHGLLGCAFYGALTTKLLALRAERLPRWALPIAGSLLVVMLTGIWLTSSLWFFTNVEFPALP